MAARHPLVYPEHQRRPADLHNWRRCEWYTALDAAGVEAMVSYAMRHTFAAFSIGAGVSLFYLARLMGTSVEQIDATYGHLLADSEEYLRALLDTYAAAEAAGVHRSGSELKAAADEILARFKENPAVREAIGPKSGRLLAAVHIIRPWDGTSSGAAVQGTTGCKLSRALAGRTRPRCLIGLGCGLACRVSTSAVAAPT